MNDHHVLKQTVCSPVMRVGPVASCSQVLLVASEVLRSRPWTTSFEVNDRHFFPRLRRAERFLSFACGGPRGRDFLLFFCSVLSMPRCAAVRVCRKRCTHQSSVAFSCSSTSGLRGRSARSSSSRSSRRALPRTMARTLAAFASIERKSRHGYRARSGGGMLLPPLVVVLARVLWSRTEVCRPSRGLSFEVHKKSKDLVSWCL